MAGISAVQPARDHVRGAVDGRVTLVEYGDFQCRCCGDAHPVVRALLNGYHRLREGVHAAPRGGGSPRRVIEAASG